MAATLSCKSLGGGAQLWSIWLATACLRPIVSHVFTPSDLPQAGCPRRCRQRLVGPLSCALQLWKVRAISA